MPPSNPGLRATDTAARVGAGPPGRAFDDIAAASGIALAAAASTLIWSLLALLL